MLVDALTRHNLNDTFGGTYYLTWTVFCYLPELLFSLLLLTSYIYTHFSEAASYRAYVLLFMLNFIYLTELVDFTSLNCFLGVLTQADASVNILLANLLNKYHPFIFYLSVVVLYYLWIAASVDLIQPANQLTSNARLYATKLLAVTVLSCNYTALWLGSWWAFQEGTWGGWWNSDASEMLGLLVLLLPIVLIHSKLTYLKTWRAGFSVSLGCLSFLAVYYFTQVNYELTSHNFGSRFFFFFNNNLMLLNMLLLSTLLLFLLASWYLFVVTASTYTLLPKTLGLRSWQKTLLCVQRYLTTFFFIWIFSSLAPLIDIFTQKSIHVTDIFLTDAYFFAQVALTLSVVILFFKLSTTRTPYTLALVAVVPTFGLLAPTLSYGRWSWVQFIHFMLISFLLVVIHTGNLTFLYWAQTTSSTSFYVTDDTYFFYTPIFVCDAGYVNKIYTVTSKHEVFITSWTSLSSNNTYNTDQFWLLQNSTTLFNYFYCVVDCAKVFMLIEVADVSLLSVLATLVASAVVNRSSLIRLRSVIGVVFYY